MNSKKLFSTIFLCAASACLAAWNGKSEKPKCDENAFISYGIYQCEVSTPEQLAGLAEMLDSLAVVPTINVTLTNDLVFGDSPTSVSEFKWKPIKKFNGVFNGNDHTIFGLNIVSSDSALGLFGYFNGSAAGLTIAHSKLNFKSDSTYKSHFYAGLFAGEAETKRFYEVHGVANTINFNDSLNSIYREVYLGGLVGYLSGTADSCSNSSEIVANLNEVEAYIGGIFGEGSDISNSANSGNITVDGNVSWNDVFVGGIAGWSGKRVEYCKNSGTVLAKGVRVGGLVGYGDEFEFCENSGSVTNTYLTQGFDSSFVGGIAGAAGHILNSFNKGNVNGEYAGGLAGRIVASTKNINEGVVTGSLYAGGIGGVCSRRS